MATVGRNAYNPKSGAADAQYRTRAITSDIEFRQENRVTVWSDNPWHRSIKLFFGKARNTITVTLYR